MLYGEIFRQRLKIMNAHVVAETINYLEMKFAFLSDDWAGLDKWAHFAKEDAVYDIRLTDDCIRKEDHLNLSEGFWRVYLHGNEFRDGEMIERITTNTELLRVEPTGVLSGEPFPTVPPSAGEQIVAAAVAAESGAKSAAEEAGRAAGSAKDSADLAAGSADAAAKSAETAGSVVPGVVQAAKDAEDAKVAAESAKANSAQFAENSKKSADSARTSAEESLGSKEAAAQSAAEARKAANEAAKYEPEIFWAEYGVTTYAEVDRARLDGKVCMCNYGRFGLHMRLVQYSPMIFAAFDGNTYLYMLRLNQDDTWEEIQPKLLRGSDVITTVNENSQNTHIPTAKAVYDAILEYGGSGDGSGGILKETDPTVPSWAKEKTKPSYTKAEVGLGNVDNVKQYSVSNPPPYPVTSVNGQAGAVSLGAGDVGALPSSTEIPAKTSELTNDSGFITKAVADLVNYYKKSETYTQAEVNELVSAIPKFTISVVSALPTSGISATTVYLVKSGADGDLYTEYIYVNGAWEILGSQRVDLTGYATEAWVNTKLTDYLQAAQLQTAINTALAQAKASGEFDGADGVSITSVKQTTTSTADGGANVVTVTLSNGQTATFEVKNGSKGDPGDGYTLTEADKQEIAGMIPGGGDGSGGLVVLITENVDGTLSTSHTSLEILAAAETKTVTAIVAVAMFGGPVITPLVTAHDEIAVFVFTFVSSNETISVRVEVLGNDVRVYFDGFGEVGGATATDDGKVGLVPAPSAGQQDYVLHGDGTWRKIQVSGSGGGVNFTPGNALELTSDGVLNVRTASGIDSDNTLPVTSAAVAATVGNIEILLSTI